MALINQVEFLVALLGLDLLTAFVCCSEFQFWLTGEMEPESLSRAMVVEL